MSSSTASTSALGPISDSAVGAALRELLPRSAMGLSPTAFALAYADWSLHVAVSPLRRAKLVQTAFAFPSQIVNRILAETSGDTGFPAKPNQRFDGNCWRQWPFNLFRETFKASEAWRQDAAQFQGMSNHDEHMVDFYSRQVLDALSPSN